METRLFEQLESLKNIDITQAALPGAHVLRNAAFDNYQGNTDEDAFEDEFMFEEAEGGAMVIAREEFDISFIEFGTSKTEAQPFMRPAIDDNQDTIREAISKNIDEQIKELVR